MYGSTGLSLQHRSILQARPIIAALLIAAGVGIGSCSAGENSSQTTTELAQLEQEMFQAINRHRESNGRNRLQWKTTIAEQARRHSRAMAADRVPLGHEGAEERTKNIATTIRWVSISENVAYSTKRTDMIQFLLERWLASSGHRKNIEGDFNLTGIGAAVSPDGRYFFTQIFALTE